MPELPEVETIVRGLREPLVGRTFTGVTITWPNSIKTPIPELESRLPGQRIEAITRRGKYLQFHLSGGDTLLIHLKMSGDLLVEPGIIIAQTPQGAERVDCGTVIGVILSGAVPERRQFSP